MQTIPQCTLSVNDQSDLAIRQAEIDREPIFEEQVSLAKRRFAEKPSALFSRVRRALQLSVGDLVRCGYCEDSCADEVEHVWPKNYFPNRTFDSSNYLFACGICNPAKNDKFSVWHRNAWVDLRAHRKTNGITPPPSSNSRFIDPLTEAPLDYLWLDIVGQTLMFVPIHDEGTREYERAQFTIDALRLNREVLVEMRKNAYSGFRDRIYRYVECKVNGDGPEILNSRLHELRRAPHQTVRLEIGRQLAIIEKPHQAIAYAPEVFL